MTYNMFIHLTNSSIQKLQPEGAGENATAKTGARHSAEEGEAVVGGDDARVVRLGHTLQPVELQVGGAALQQAEVCEMQAHHEVAAATGWLMAV